jgi:hypothetical protein
MPIGSALNGGAGNLGRQKGMDVRQVGSLQPFVGCCIRRAWAQLTLPIPGGLPEKPADRRCSMFSSGLFDSGLWQAYRVSGIAQAGSALPSCMAGIAARRELRDMWFYGSPKWRNLMLPRYSVISACTLLLVNLTAPTLPWALSADNPQPGEPERIRVTCPAIEIDESERPINTLGVPGTVQLVVLGSTKRLAKQDESGEPLYELKVEKVMYGSAPEMTLHLHEHAGPERQIFGLVPQAYGGPTDYIIKYNVDVKEEKSQMAMAAARLDYHALAADSIFVGKETAVDGLRHTIEVVRLLHGSEPKPSEKKTMEIRDHMRFAGKVVQLRPEPMLYFVRIERRGYRFDTRLPIACEADVVAALNRRDLYPIVDTVEEAKKLRAREVVFRGSIEDAIDFLSSEREGSVNLAALAIMRQKDAAPEKLAAAIQHEMLRQAEPAWGEFRKLHNLVRLL